MEPLLHMNEGIQPGKIQLAGTSSSYEWNGLDRREYVIFWVSVCGDPTEETNPIVTGGILGNKMTLTVATANDMKLIAEKQVIPRYLRYLPKGKCFVCRMQSVVRNVDSKKITVSWDTEDVCNVVLVDNSD